jgi:mannan endo-1,4-beta-mannosidase
MKTISFFVLLIFSIPRAMGIEQTFLQGLTSPQGSYRWMDVADQIYDVDDLDGYSYNTSYDYTQASVQVDFFSGDDTLHGALSAANLKPHFAYQFKLVGDPDIDSEANQRIGLTGRWWQEEWNGSEWANGQNLNNKGDGSSPSPNDQIYFSRRDIPDASSPTGRRYRYTGYLVFDYFVTDAFGNISLSFDATSSYHVLWKTTQRSRTNNDGPTTTTTYDVQLPDPVSAYDVDYPQAMVTIFGEWERLPGGDVMLPPGTYEAEFLLTEESFHGSGWAGGWAAAMAGGATFDIVVQPVNDPMIVAVADGAFTVNGLPHYFAGVNYWQGMNLAVDGPSGDRARLGRELDHLQQLGVANLRVMAASEGPNSEPYRMMPVLLTSPGVYDLGVLDGLDYLLAEIGAREMRAVMVLNNYWHWSGGMAQYVSWNDGTPIPYPPAHGWAAFMAYAADFYECAQCQVWYRDHIAAIINRLNPYTGVRYRQDPAIFSWELANEPRGYPAEWIDDTAAYIRSLDRDHLVTTGSEGSMGGDFIATHDGPDIDYTTIHIWPQNWGWYSPELPGTYPAAELNARSYFQQHVTESEVLGKPMVLEEFGLARDWEQLHDIYDPDAPTTLRDLFFGAMFEEVVMSITTGGAAAGDNLWAWAGEARPGDAWIGDPPHELAGWYSVYDTDDSTLAVLSAHALQLTVCEIDADCADGDSCNGDEWCDSGSGDCQTGTPLNCDDGDACTTDSCDPDLDACTHVAPPVPNEVHELRLTRPSPVSTIVSLAWTADPVATSYDVYRGHQVDLNDLTCFLSGVTSTSTEDDGVEPDAGTLLIYLMTASNCSGKSVLGDARLNSNPCQRSAPRP